MLFLYRYLGVLGEEALRMGRAYDLRSNGHSLSIRHYGMLVGRLLVRTWERAERIYLAMCARGFNGDFAGGRETRFGRDEWLFVVAWCAVFAVLRTQDVAHRLGSVVLGASQ
jgi:cobalt/nickel transport system permease protein